MSANNIQSPTKVPQNENPNDANAEPTKEEIKPRQRAPGGVWIHSTDIPHAFTNMIVYHNLNKFEFTETLTDIWTNGS